MPTSPANEEVDFHHSELFFSRTDTRGVIQFGNDVFQRISQYSWDELHGAPHKIIRHPDMPKAVFWLLWETIKAGKPIGAYVKNRAKSGQIYWVFAIVTPITDGYISVRLKPTSEIKAIVEDAYAQVLEKEAKDGLAPSESAAVLLEALRGLGFKDYETFMAHALSREVLSRDTLMNRKANQSISRYDEMLRCLKEIEQESQEIVSAFSSVRASPVNMGVVASQLGEAALPLGVISQSFSDLVVEIHKSLEAFVAKATSVSEQVNRGLFVTCAKEVQHEVVEIFVADHSEAALDIEVPYLDQMAQEYARTGMREIYEEIRDFEQNCKRLNRTLAGLSITSIVGQIESARIGPEGATIDGIMKQLNGFHARTSQTLSSVQDLIRVLLEDIKSELIAQQNTNEIGVFA